MPLSYNDLSLKDARQWFNDCVVIKGSELFYVAGIGESADVGLEENPKGDKYAAHLTQGSAEGAWFPLSDIAPYWPQERLINVGREALFLKRTADRQWSRSLRRTNASLQTLHSAAERKVLALSHMNFGEERVLKGLSRLDYPSYSEALEKVMSGEVWGVAFSPNYAIVSHAGCAEPTLHYKEWAVGTASPRGVLLESVAYFLADELSQFVPTLEVK
ncbi:hypothetical protein [Zhongshania sp.]|uniref:hypothetical protein n=1 Tax=Zhongshania sp. TaxID=1971902 RepID=UPI003562EF32